MTEKEKFWLSHPPSKCDFGTSCQGDGEITDTFVDGATTLGPWACMCLSCHKAYGRGLGTGLGQMYQRQPDNRWKKIS